MANGEWRIGDGVAQGTLLFAIRYSLFATRYSLLTNWQLTSMDGKVTLEDHFATEATLGDSQPFGAHVWPELRYRLLDFHEQRLRLMDAAGIEIMIASLNAPAIQGIADAGRAAEPARQANDALAHEVARRPDRFVGVAPLPMQDPDRAIEELQRC